MKKYVLTLVAFVAALLSAGAQSVEFHQSYGSDKCNAPYLATRVIASYFYTNDDESLNLFTWNAFDRNNANTLLYTEHRLGNSNFLFHPEIRLDYMYGPLNENAYDINPMIGLSYEIVFNNGLSVYLTPKAMMTYDNHLKWSNPDMQFSINSSYEGGQVYYEGYIDTNWFGHANGFSESNTIGLFTEQKAYYKMTDTFQIGGCVVFAAGKLAPKMTGSFVQPYLSLRVVIK